MTTEIGDRKHSIKQLNMFDNVLNNVENHCNILNSIVEIIKIKREALDEVKMTNMECVLENLECIRFDCHAHLSFSLAFIMAF